MKYIVEHKHNRSTYHGIYNADQYEFDKSIVIEQVNNFSYDLHMLITLCKVKLYIYLQRYIKKLNSAIYIMLNNMYYLFFNKKIRIIVSLFNEEKSLPIYNF